MLCIVRVFLIGLSSSIGLSSAQCRDGWTSHGDSCYLFTNEEESWGEAVAECRAFRAQLVEIESEPEYQFIIGQLYARTSKPRHWLGASDIESEREWRWLNSDNILVKPHWGPNEPNGQTNQNCLAMYHEHGDSYYIDMDCSVHAPFICEMLLHNDNNIVG